MESEADKLEPGEVEVDSDVKKEPTENIAVKTENDPEVKEEKPLLKSSAEILSELFSSFNSTPPANLDDITIKKTKKSKKKHKKKHKKKRKKDDNDSSDEKKHKKSKKKKREASSSDSDLSDDSKQQEVEKILDFKSMYLAITEDIKSTLAQKIKAEAEESHVLDVSKIKQEKDLPDSTTPDKPKKDEGPKIHIQSLKNSATYLEAERNREKSENSENDSGKRKKRTKSKDDDLNLTESTDEETRTKHRKKRKHSRHKSKEKHHKHSSKEKTTLEELSDRHSSHRDHKSSERYGDREKDRDKHKLRSFYDEEPRHRSIKERLGYRREYSHNHDHHSKTHKPYNRHRSRSRSTSPRTRFDKKKLLEIARKNAILMLKNGSLPGYVGLGPQAQEKVIAAINTGGKTIDELTDFCKNLSREEAMGDLSSVTSGDEMSDSDKPFNHPFQLKERPSSIIMNIPNGTQIPVKTPQEKAMDKSSLLMQFPVSSGTHHRKTENWIPVPPKKSEPLPPKAKIVAKSFVEPSTSKHLQTVVPQVPVAVPSTPNIPLAIQAAPQVQVSNNMIPAEGVFPTPVEGLDIGSIVSQRLTAMRKLQENPHDVEAIGEMYRAQREMQHWASSKQQPGQFTGSTDVQILTAAELSGGYQAWARKDQLVTATPVSGGMGMHLLQKMGWRPGEGLGKEKNGALQPLMLEVKLDKKGLVANEEIKGKRQPAPRKVMTTKTLENKHPVSLLGEYACKRKLGPPVYELCFECGPSHKKNFLFKVKLNGMEYQPSVASANKKQAKADAATVCLQQLGILTS